MVLLRTSRVTEEILLTSYFISLQIEISNLKYLKLLSLKDTHERQAISMTFHSLPGESSQPRDQTQVSRIAGGYFTI